MRILFMGTPEFAVASLKRLVEDGHEICGVITQPDKPKNRGHKMQPTPVKEYALSQGLEVYQPLKARDGEAMGIVEQLDPELIVVAAYGKILPEDLLNYPKYGCVNVHGSLLPAYRGAAPMQRAIMAGEKTVGVTTMKMAKGMDTGDMYLKAEMPLTTDDNFETVHDKLADMGAQILVHTLRGLEAGTLKAHPQDEALATHAAKIEKADCLLSFDKSAREVFFYARGLTPIPLPFAYLKGKMIKFTSLTLAKEEGVWGSPGEVISLDDGKITVACATGALVIDGVLPEGKKNMASSDFVRGRGIAVGDMFTDKKEM